MIAECNHSFSDRCEAAETAAWAACEAKFRQITAALAAGDSDRFQDLNAEYRRMLKSYEAGEWAPKP
jgi:hypothetical protein